MFVNFVIAFLCTAIVTKFMFASYEGMLLLTIQIVISRQNALRIFLVPADAETQAAGGLSPSEFFLQAIF